MNEWLARRLPSRRGLVVGLAVLAALAILGSGGWLWYAGQQRQGLAAYAEAMTHVQAAQAAEAPAETRATAIRELEAALQRFPSAATAPEAAYQLGNLRYAGQEWAAARGAYQVALAKGATTTVRTLAQAGIGYTWEAERNFAKSGEAFLSGLGPLRPKDFFYEELLLDLARVQELAGNRGEAIVTYRRVLKELPQSRRADEVRTRLATLGAGPQ